MGTLVLMEPTLKYQPDVIEVLTLTHESGSGTVHGRQFDWGGLLPKSNGGAQRSAQRGWQSRLEGKAISRLNCESDGTNRHESGP